MGKNIPYMPKPLTAIGRKAQATLKRNRIIKQQKINKFIEQNHSDHLAVAVQIRGEYYLWCKQCQTTITPLTDQEYKNYLELFPPKLRRVK